MPLHGAGGTARFATMYDATDPRAALAEAADAPPATEFSGADYLKFYQMAPDMGEPLVRTWCGRGQNFLVAYAQVEPGAVLRRTGQPDEYALLLPDRQTEVIVESGGERETIAGRRIAFIPPGDSVVRVANGGTVVRLFSHRAEDIAALCANAAAYAAPQPNTTPLRGMARACRWLPRTELQPGRLAGAGAVRPDFPLHDPDGELSRPVGGAARSREALAAPS